MQNHSSSESIATTSSELTTSESSTIEPACLTRVTGGADWSKYRAKCIQDQLGVVGNSIVPAQAGNGLAEKLGASGAGPFPADAISPVLGVIPAKKANRQAAEKICDGGIPK